MKQQLANSLTDAEILEFLEARAENSLTHTDIEALQPSVPCAVRLQLTPVHYWKCGKRIKAARGYVYGVLDIPEEQVFVSLRQVTDTGQLIALITDLRRRDETITSVGFNYSKTAGAQYSSAHCPYCRRNPKIHSGFTCSVGMRFAPAISVSAQPECAS